MVYYPIPKQMSQVLTTPVEGDIDLEIDRNDGKFDTLNEGISTATTFYSEAQGLVGKIGVAFPGPLIQPTNAVELFVEPFSGDWNKITACGDAMKKAGEGLVTIGSNLTLGLAQLCHSTDGWKGNTATAFELHMGVHAAVYVGAGAVMDQGHIVFNGIADIALEIAGLIVELIDTALDIAVWLIEKVVKYARPWIGWAALAWEVVTDGWNAIQDTIDTLQTLYDTITTVFELHDQVKEWVETIPATLAVFQDLITVVQNIPNLAETPILTAAQIRNDLEGIGNDSAEIIAQREAAEAAITESEERLADLAGEIEEPETPTGIGDLEAPEFPDQ